MNPIVLKVIQWLIPVISPLLVAALKAALAGQWGLIPDWIKPLLSAVIGAVLGGLTGDPAALEITMPLGAGLGLAGSKLRDVAVGRADSTPSER